MKKKILILGIIAMGVVLAAGADAAPCQYHNVYGWAWSENVGWMSFSCGNCDSDFDGTTDTGKYAQCPEEETIKDYGVNIDSSGNLSGYAWSSNIGWVSFNDFDGSHAQAELDFGTNEVSGWARALANGDGWDGWIKLMES